MRLLRLGLDRFGPFTGQSILLREDAHLHVVYGPNEAGKSSALAAVTDLLFGIAPQTKHAYLHAMRDLCLSGTMRNRAGQTLSFRRRKNKPVLTDLDDVPLPDDSLAGFLGGVTREMFQRAFGLDAKALRESGKDLKTSHGELGTALFAAASGLRGLSEVQKALENEADGIFGTRQAGRRILYQALARHDEARKALRQHETRRGALQDIQDAIKRSNARREEIKARRADIATELAELDRLKRAGPSLNAISDALAGLDALGTLPDAPPGRGGELKAALEARTHAQREDEQARDALARQRQERDAIAVDDRLLSMAQEIEGQKSLLGQYEKALDDIPAVRREADGFSADLLQLACRLGLPDVETVLAGQPDDASVARVGELLDQGRALRQHLEACQSAFALCQTRRDEDLQTARQSGEQRDPAPFRERLQAFEELLQQARERMRLEVEIAAEEADLTRTACRLIPRVPDLSALVSLPFPSPEFIASAARARHIIDTDVERLREAVLRRREDLKRCDLTLAELMAGGEVPSRERIAAARDRRDAAWSHLRAALLDEADAPSPDQWPILMAQLESRSGEADMLADAAIADAERVARHALARRAFDASRTALAEAEAALDQRLAQSDAMVLDWQALWRDTGLVPAAPADMLAWRSEVRVILERAAKLEPKRAQAAAIADAQANARPALAALAAELGLADLQGMDLTVLAKRIEGAIARIEADFMEGTATKTRRELLEREVATAAQALRAAVAAQDGWQEAFATALPRIGLHKQATPAEAASVLGCWREVPAIASSRTDRLRRVRSMERDNLQFAQAMAIIIAAVAPDQTGQAPDLALKHLSAHLDRQREARARRQSLDRAVGEAERACEDRSRAFDKAAMELARLAAPLAIAEDEIEPLAHRLEQRDRLLNALANARMRLADAADGIAEDRLQAAWAAWDPQDEARRRSMLESEAEMLDRDQDAAFKAREDAQDTLNRLEIATDAETAQQQLRDAEAEMAEAGRDWVVVNLAARLIGAGIARRRAETQEPVLTRAGQIFSNLTGADYRGLGQRFEGDVPRLTGLRASGASVDLDDMSEGTSDQVYLALRLALLEEHATRAEPPPFLADDLFAPFDDARTAHGLRALANLGGAVQPILFTHHRFVAQAAVTELGTAADIIELTPPLR